MSAEGTPPKQRYKLIVSDCDGENAEDPPTGRAADVAGVVARRHAARVRVVRGQGVVHRTCRRCARRERSRVSARAGINGAPALSPDGGMLALTLSRKDGNLDIYTLDLATQVLTRMTDDRASTPSRAGRRTAASSISRPTARAARRSTVGVGQPGTRGARDLRRALQRAAARVAGRQAARRRATDGGNLSDRRRWTCSRRRARADATAGWTRARASRRTARRSFMRRRNAAAACSRRCAVDGTFQQTQTPVARRRARTRVGTVPRRS